MVKNFEQSFIKDKYWRDEGFRRVVEKSAKKNKTSEKPEKPEEKIPYYLERLERVTDRIDPKTKEQGKLFLEISLYPKFIIKPENISDKYIKSILLINFADQHGYERHTLKNKEIKQYILEKFKKEKGQDFISYQISKEEREDNKNIVINNQKAGLKTWFDYLTSAEAKHIPIAFRYWAFSEMLKLGNFNEERKAFNPRTENTTASFPELNQQALSLVFDEILRKQTAESSKLVIDDEIRQLQFRKFLESENFGKLYAFTTDYVKSLRLPTERLIITNGEWQKFSKGTKTEEIIAALKGFNTGWCITGQGFAQSYLEKSDLWIYFSEDIDGKNSIPRACIINSEKNGITEVRGIISNKEAQQHLDSYITPIVSEKLKQMPNGEKWQTTMEDMKYLAKIHFKYLQNEPLEKEDLIFLYEIDRPIYQSGYQRDPRIEEIRKTRNIKKDLSKITGFNEDEISITQEEALKENIKYHYGDLDLGSLISAQGLKLPKLISGNLDLRSLTSTEGLELPKSINGDLDLRNLTSAQGLKLPKSISDYLDLRSLTSAEGLKLPESIGHLDLGGLTSAQGLKLPESIGHLDLGGLTSAQGLKLPESIGYLDLRNLTSVQGLELPELIGHLDLGGLTSAQGLKLPESIGHLNLGSLISAQGLKLPKLISGNLDLRSLTSAEGLELPESINGYLDLRNLTSVEKKKLREKFPHLAHKIIG